MDVKQKRRYLLAVYLIIAIAAVSFMVIGFSNEDSWKSILFNLSTELLGVAIVFFLVDFLFSVDDWNLSEKVQQLLIQLRNERPDASRFFEPSPQLEAHFATADQIDLCGVTLTSTLNRGFSSIRERLFSGANVRLLIIKPARLPLQMAMSRSENTDSINYFKKRLETTLNDVEYMHKNLSEKRAEGRADLGTFQVKLMDYAPSFGIISFDSHRSNATMYVEIYPHHSGYGNPPKFSLTKHGDSEWHKYYSDQFEYMWSYAEDWSPNLSVDSVSDDEQSSNLTISDFFHSQNLNHDFSDTDEILISGITLTRTLRDYNRTLRQRYLAGAKIKIILLDPNIDSILEEFAGWTSLRGTNSDDWKSRLGLNKKFITGGIVGNTPSTGVGTVEIGYVPFIPSFGLIILDPQKDNAQCTVEMYHHKTDTPELTFDLRKTIDRYWFDFFHDQFEQIWDSCRVEQVPVGNEQT